MKSLLILRHAKSSWSDPYASDHDRQLNKRGKADAPRMGALLHREELVPDLIISSSAVRAYRTAEAVAETAGYEDEIVKTRSLYHAGTDEFISVLRRVPDDYQIVMVVGHNPGLEEFLEDIAGVYERMVTAALAYVSLPIESWQDLDEDTTGNLEGFWIPREFGSW